MRVGTVAEVLDLYRRWGIEQYDEEVTQLEHALQVAALARRDGAADPLVAAALLHDVGHLLELAGGRPADAADAADGADRRHEDAGAALLADLFGPDVTDPIALHVQAKRYLCATDAGYAARLSPGSVASLARQGGPFDPSEAAAFAARDGAAAAISLRRWDDAGKVVGLDVGTIDDHRPLLERLSVA